MAKEPRTLPLRGIVALVALYGLLAVVVARLSGTPYDAFGNSAANLVRAVVLPSAVMTVLVISLVSYLRWWPRVLTEDRPVRRWLWTAPVAMALAPLLLLDYRAMPVLGVRYLAAAAGGTLLVGVAEELTFRGVMLTGLRVLMDERGAWFWSTFAFGALHVLTALMGRALPLSLVQAAAAFLLGTALYLARRASGGLVAPVLIHALWDFTAFTTVGARVAHAPIEWPGALLAGFGLWLVLFASALVAVVAIARGRSDVPAAG